HASHETVAAGRHEQIQTRGPAQIGSPGGTVQPILIAQQVQERRRRPGAHPAAPISRVVMTHFVALPPVASLEPSLYQPASCTGAWPGAIAARLTLVPSAPPRTGPASIHPATRASRYRGRIRPRTR